MIKINETSEKTIILDNMSFAASFRETLLKENRRMLEEGDVGA